MASGETNFASLPSKTSPSNADMFLLEDTEDTKKINYSALADAILNKLTSKTYSGLDTSAKNLVSAINELNSKTLNNGIKNQNSSKTYKLSSGCSYLLTYVRIREGNIAESSLNVGLISTGEKTSAKSLIQWIVKNGQNQSMFEFDETDSSILRVNVPASTWIVMSITKL